MVFPAVPSAVFQLSEIWNDHKIEPQAKKHSMYGMVYLPTFGHVLWQMPVSIPHIECLGNVSNAASPN